MVDFGAVGHVSTEAEKPYRRARLHDDGRQSLDPTLFASRARLQAIHDPAGLERVQDLLHHGNHGGAIVRMHVAFEDRGRTAERALRHAENLFDIGRPGDLAGPDIPQPDADISGFERDRDQFGIAEKWRPRGGNRS